MVKYSYSVKVYLDATNHIDFADSETSTAGTIVYNQLEGKGAIRVVKEGHEYIIKKFMYADVTKTSSEVTYVDDICPTEVSE